MTVSLHVRTQTGTDDFNRPVYTETKTDVTDVLVGQPTTEDLASVTATLDLTGRKAVYWLAVPKGDTHNWENAVVELPAPMAGVYRTIGKPIAGIEANIPLRWNKKVLLEIYG